MNKLQNHELLGARFKHPGLEHDMLFQQSYMHVGDYTSHCKNCDTYQLVKRKSRNDSDKNLFIYYQGRVATGNSVIMNGEKRDSISAQCGGALCIEMEVAGVEVNCRCLVIRGISDYADSHKSDLWRSYAAGKAVVFARELLGKIPARDIKDKMASGKLALYLSASIAIEVEDYGSRMTNRFRLFRCTQEMLRTPGITRVFCIIYQFLVPLKMLDGEMLFSFMSTLSNTG